MPLNEVAIIIVHLGNFSVTSDCLTSLEQSGDAFDVILVDNGATDGSVPRLQAAHPYIQVLHARENLGFTGGNNLGMRYAIQKGYAYLLLLNNDTFVAPGFLKPLVEVCVHNPDIGAVQPRIYYHHNRQRLWNAGSFYKTWWGITYTRRFNKADTPLSGRACTVDWITGCAFLIRTDVLVQTGLFAVPMFLYYEDADLSFRIRANGYRLFYQPASVIYHIAGASGTQKNKEGNILPFIHYYNLRNRWWFVKKHTPWYGRPSALLATAGYSAAVCCYFLLRGRWGKLRAVAKATIDGIGGKIIYEGTAVAETASTGVQRIV